MKEKKAVKGGFLLGFIGAAALTALLVYLLGTTGMMGLVRWEKSYRMYVILIGCVCVIVWLVTFLALTKSRFLKVLAKALGIIFLIVSLAGGYLVYSFSTGGPDQRPDLNYYSSKDAALADTDSVKVAVISDTHWGNSSSKPENRNHMLDTLEKSDSDLVVFCGDMTEQGSVTKYADEAIADLEAHLATKPVHFVLGNHDTLINSEKVFMRYFEPDETDSNHVLEIAPGVHWVVFTMLWDMSDIDKEDITWLEETLASFPEEDTVIVNAHSFIYGSGVVSEGGGKWWDIPGYVDNIAPILEKNNVDLFICGHQHSMEMLEKNGVPYALVGPGGCDVYHGFTVKSEADQLFYDGETFGFTTVEIGGGMIELDFCDMDGASIKHFSFPTK